MTLPGPVHLWPSKNQMKLASPVMAVSWQVDVKKRSPVKQNLDMIMKLGRFTDMTLAR